MALPALSLAVVGINYPNKSGPTRRFELAAMKPGESVDLVPEPKNRCDENAVAAFSARGIQVGYLASERAAWIVRLIRARHEVRAVYQGLDPHCGWIRVAFDGEKPVLPPGAEDRPPTPPPRPHPNRVSADFYPDFIPPDD